MKVLSIREPYATLIKTKKKKIETRSWKTTYRGEIYIHASKTKPLKKDLEKKEVMNLIEEKFHNEYIICKAKLVDCIYMDEEFLKEIKKNHQEYICGEYKLGRYAWVLDEVEELETPIKAKGKLGIWTFEEV